jgi:hypothetical protein
MKSLKDYKNSILKLIDGIIAHSDSYSMGIDELKRKLKNEILFSHDIILYKAALDVTAVAKEFKFAAFSCEEWKEYKLSENQLESLRDAIINSNKKD